MSRTQRLDEFRSIGQRVSSRSSAKGQIVALGASTIVEGVLAVLQVLGLRDDRRDRQAGPGFSY